MIAISATLDYILKAIKERNYIVEGVNNSGDKWGGVYLNKYEVKHG